VPAATPACAPAQAQPIWPDLFSEGDRRQAEGHLARLNWADQQQVLDEIAWQHETGKPVRSPVALLRTLCCKVLAGEFSPDGAHRVAAGREQAANDHRCQRDADKAPQRAGPTTTMDRPNPEVLARLAAIRAALLQRSYA
jgi:hypothetical protein